jgi:hypothetical protein
LLLQKGCVGKEMLSLFTGLSSQFCVHDYNNSSNKHLKKLKVQWSTIILKDWWEKKDLFGVVTKEVKKNKVKFLSYIAEKQCIIVIIVKLKIRNFLTQKEKKIRK